MNRVKSTFQHFNHSDFYFTLCMFDLNQHLSFSLLFHLPIYLSRRSSSEKIHIYYDRTATTAAQTDPRRERHDWGKLLVCMFVCV